MARTVLASLILAATDLPDGLAPGKFEVTLSTAGAPDVVVETDQASLTFQDLSPGDYVVSACRLAETGERISQPVSASINVPVPAQVDVPSTITLALA